MSIQIAVVGYEQVSDVITHTHTKLQGGTKKLAH